MNAFFGIKRLRLKARRAGDGFIVDGTLHWVSNLGEGHVFGTVAECVEYGRKVFFLAECGAPGVEIKRAGPFIALEGTATYAVRFKEAPIPYRNVLADPIAGYLASARPQRRLREAQFVAIVTSAMKQLRKMLHEIDEDSVVSKPQ